MFFPYVKGSPCIRRELGYVRNWGPQDSRELLLLPLYGYVERDVLARGEIGLCRLVGKKCFPIGQKGP